MFKFPKNLYTDVRIENVFETNIAITLGTVHESKVRRYKAAFIRVFDGERWYYSSISEIDNIQNEINQLAGYAKPKENIYENDVVKALEINKEECILFSEESVSMIDLKEKLNLLKNYYSIINNRPLIKTWTATYLDKKVVKEFYSSKGSEIRFDTQTAGMKIGMSFANENNNLSEGFQCSGTKFQALKGKEKEIEAFAVKCEEFLQNAKAITPGKYTVVLSPEAAGVFAHESFGHKSEADFMIGDETMKKEWEIGKQVGANILSIVDDGHLSGNGYAPFDDEGTKAQKTFLVEKGILKGRLHSSVTAASLEEQVTGNARAMNFEFEPIVRMTTTYIMPGEETKEQLISEIKDGLYVETIKHGSGMSTFTIAPSLAYSIKDGKMGAPVNISVITGNVMETLEEIDGLSNEVQILSFVIGGCGKMEQYPLPVGFGGPYVRVRNMDVQ